MEQDPKKLLLIIGGILIVAFIAVAFQHLKGTSPTISGSVNVNFSSLNNTNPAPPAETAHSAPSTNTGQALDCGKDMNCFIREAVNCSPAKLQFYALGETAELQIKGKNQAGLCIFADTANAVGANMTVTDTCTLSTTYIVKVLQKWQSGSFSTGDLPPQDCTAINSKTGQTLNQPAATPTQTATTQTSPTMKTPPIPGIGIYDNETVTSVQDVTLQFKAWNFPADEFYGTFTVNGQSQYISLKIGQSVSALGYTITLKSIETQNNGTVNGHPVTSNYAVLALSRQ